MKLKISFKAPGTIAISIICVIVFVCNLLLLGVPNQLLFSVYRSSLSNPFTYFRFIGHIFGHSNVQHIVGNLTLFLLVAPIVEERCGTLRLLGYIFLTGIVIGLFQFILFPASGLLGLSGVVFMLIVLASYGDCNGAREIPITVVLVILLWIGGEVWDSITVRDNVSQFSHLLGGLCGFLLGLRKN